jgi:adenylate cyclase
MKEEKTRRLAAIMFTDIVGYTLLMQQDEQAAVKARTVHRQVFNEQHKQHHGEILQYFGDGTLSVFQSVVEAVECAINIQQKFHEGESVPIRIGLHLGDIVFDGVEVYGDGVNLASRIESMGIAGGILLSSAVNDELKNQEQISTISLGHFELKNITHPVEIFSVINDGIKIPIRSELKGKYKEEGKSIAVLPFVSMSPNKDDEYFSDGMTEEIINALAKIKELKVTSRTSSFYFKNKNIPVPQIGQELNVSTILEGSIRLSGNKVRITAQLIDVVSDFHFWSETFDRSMDDIFAVQDEISLLIADRLREHLGHFDIADHLVDAPVIPVEVYKRYLKGRYHLMKLSLSGVEKGISILQDVIAEQPNFALAFLDINMGYAVLGTMGQMPAVEAFMKGKPFLDKAIELDENLPQSQLNLAWIACWQNWDLVGTYEHLSKALQISPADDIYLTFANTLVIEGKFKAAHNYIEKALELDPFSAINHHFKGFIYYLQEDYEQAILCLKKSLSLKPDLPFPSLYIGESLLLMGEITEGLTFFQNLPDDQLGGLTKLGGTTLAYAFKEDIDKVSDGITKLETALETDSMGSAMNFLILIQTTIGRHDKALKLIESGIAYRLPLMILLNTEPVLKPLRSNPQFQELMRGVLGEKTSFKGTKRKYKKSLLNEPLLKQYRTQLEQLMSSNEPHLDPSLTLRGLAQMLEIPPNHLSQLLNEEFSKNFAEFVNTYRINFFKSKAADPSQQHMTILALAYESGFNSKTVFNTFFKKMEGSTPKEYWQKVLE